MKTSAAFLVLLTAPFLAGCSRSAPKPAGTAAETAKEEALPQAPPGSLELLFTYGSEKEKWIKEVTAEFNRAEHKVGDKPIFVVAVALGSGESIDELLEGRRQAHLTSPASGAFIQLGNAKSRTATGKDLIGPTENLVLSPVVIAMWKPMAEAIGWGKKPVGWADILSLAQKKEGWAAYNFPQWGAFKFGHTHPEYSNSGLISLFAEVYAGANKTSGLTLADVQDPKVGQFLGQIEQAVVHYGSSTGFFGRRMFSDGPQYLSAAVMYENMVIESYDAQDKPAFPVVALYPKEGTFWSDHPAGVVEREWVTNEHREAAKTYIQYLLEPAQQQRALAYGFRPGNVEVKLAAPVDREHGVDPAEPKTTLPVPPVNVMDAIIKLWHEHKKHANVVLVFDTSGSMEQDDRIAQARIGALELVSLLGDRDRLSLLPFNDRPMWSGKSLEVGPERETLNSQIGSLFPGGGTALYDSIGAAYDYLLENPSPETISAIVVLTDGADTNSRMPLETLRDKIRFDYERHTVRVFTIGYGAAAQQSVLEAIADDTKAKFYAGTPQNIREVFKEIATFF